LHFKIGLASLFAVAREPTKRTMEIKTHRKLLGRGGKSFRQFISFYFKFNISVPVIFN
jgi:hypothetical protein